MAGLIQSTIEKVKEAVKGRKTAPFDKTFQDMSLEDKLGALYREYRCEDKSLLHHDLL